MKVLSRYCFSPMQKSVTNSDSRVTLTSQDESMSSQRSCGEHVHPCSVLDDTLVEHLQSCIVSDQTPVV